MWRGLLQLKKIMRRGLPQEKKKNNGGDSHKRKRKYGGDSHKKRVGTPAKLRGCEFDKQTWKRRKNWHYTVYDTGKSDSVINSVVVWNCKICVVLKILYYTDYYTGRVNRVANRVLIWICRNCVFTENWYYTVIHTGYLHCVSNLVVFWNFRIEIWMKCCITRLITRVIQTVSNPVCDSVMFGCITRTNTRSV